MKKRKKRTVLFFIFCFAVVLFHLVWYLNYHRYQDFIAKVGIDQWGNNACLIDNVSYSAFPPQYPHFTGNLAICDYRSEAPQKGDVLVDMIIWPIPFQNKYKIGISIQTVENALSEAESSKGMYEITTKSINLELDENLQFLKEYNENEKKYFSDNVEKINEYYQKAYDMWGILGDNQKSR